MTSLDHAPPAQFTPESLGERLLAAALGTAELFAIYLGDRLGWYRSLLDEGPATGLQLAARTGTDPRYAREWLEQQAVAGLLTVHASAQAGAATAGEVADERCFALPAATAEVLTDERSLNYLAPLSRMFAAAGAQLPNLLEAYRSGGGVGWARYGADARESQADMNRPWYEHALPAALKGVASLDDALRRPGVRIADIGCGGGWSSIALARAYPEATVDAFDIDQASVELAAANVGNSDVADRVRVAAADAAHLPEATYDMAFAFECVHDMPEPVQVLAAVRRVLKPEGSVVIMDEAVGEAFVAPGDELERLMYGFSLLVCLPDSMAHQPSAATGTVMRPDTLRSYASEAGFAAVEILPITDFGFWRFYRLTQ